MQVCHFSRAHWHCMIVVAKWYYSATATVENMYAVRPVWLPAVNCYHWTKTSWPLTTAQFRPSRCRGAWDRRTGEMIFTARCTAWVVSRLSFPSADGLGVTRGGSNFAAVIACKKSKPLPLRTSPQMLKLIRAPTALSLVTSALRDLSSRPLHVGTRRTTKALTDNFYISLSWIRFCAWFCGDRLWKWPVG